MKIRLSCRPARICVPLLALVLLGGCKETLYSGLTEQQANAMLSVLLNGGIDTVKKAGPKETFGIQVEESELARAVDLLEAEGLPGEKYTDMEDMYEKEGLISSPMEERVRYMFVLSQSIAETLTNIDGILTARVHIALPENDSFTSALKPSSASVFIKYRRDYSFDNVKSEIKRVVENSVEGLSYDRIAVFMSPSNAQVASMAADPGEALVSYGPFTIRQDSVAMMKFSLLIVLVVFSVLLVTIVLLVRKLGTVDTLGSRIRHLLGRNRGQMRSDSGVIEEQGSVKGRLRSITGSRKSA